MTRTVLLVAALAACGGSNHAPAAPTAEPSAGSAEPAGSPEPVGSAEAPAEGSAAGSAAIEGSAAAPAPAAKAWKDLDKGERAQFMKHVVLPKTKELFAAFDPKMDVTCKTCHGKGVADHTFKMPNPDIQPLPATEQAFMAWVQKDPDEGKWAKFMSEQLVPAMADMLGKQPFDPKTKTGDFSCMACHTLKK